MVQRRAFHKRKNILKSIKSYFLLCIILPLAGCQNFKQSHFDWPKITAQTKPWTYWWWLGSAVDKENLTYNLEAYQKGGRAELAQKEEAEAKILQEYLPEPLSEEELVKIIQAAIKETGAESVKEMGKVMSLVMAKAKGKADGKLVNEKVRQLLS